MITRLLLTAFLSVLLSAAACAGGAASTAQAPEAPASVEISTAGAPSVRLAIGPSATPVSLADAAQALASFQAGAALHQEGRMEEAIAEYGEAIRLDPQLAMAYDNRGNAYAEMGQYRRAIQDYDEAIRLDPKNAAGYYSRGFANFELDRFERAMEDFDKAVRLCLDPKLARNNAGRALARRILGRNVEPLPEC